MPPPRRRTMDKMERVFDAQEFRRTVDEAVPDDEVARLQRKHGDSMSHAIDEFFEAKREKALSSASLGAEGAAQDAGDDADSDKPNVDSTGRKDLYVKDQYWDKSRRRWRLVNTSRAARESKKSGSCVIFVRRVYSEKMAYDRTVVEVRGPILRRALRNIFRGAYGFSLTDDDSSELENHHFFFWARRELLMLAEHYRKTDDKVALFEMGAAARFIKQEFSRTASKLDSLLPGSVEFEHLWAIFPPGCLVVGKDPLGTVTIWRAYGHRYGKTGDGSVQFSVTGEFLDWDGRKLGLGQRPLQIRSFAGITALQELPFVPLKYHPKADAIVQRVLERNARKLGFCRRGFVVQDYDGLGLWAGEKATPFTFQGRVVVDPQMMARAEPSNALLPQLEKPSTAKRAWISDLTKHGQEHEILRELLEDPDAVPAPSLASPDAGEPGPADPESEPDAGWLEDLGQDLEGGGVSPPQGRIVGRELTETEQLILSGFMYGYSLRDARWGAFAMERLEDVRWNSSIFESLVMDESLKSVLFQLVTAHSLGKSDFDDFVRGKGKGLVGLLSGPPGSGKTLTAEAIAETARMPLYAVSSGALGHEAEEIYGHLSRILALATRWRAVLLLDEADVFLARRTLSDIKRNAIVSVFLREIEYYQGLLLLTTNEAEVLDEAFQSRIHFSLAYQELDQDARRRIWENLTAKARDSKAVKVDLDAAGIDLLAELPLNGRQIKNAISIAIKLATISSSHVVTADSITAAARLLQCSGSFAAPGAQPRTASGGGGALGNGSSPLALGARPGGAGGRPPPKPVAPKPKLPRPH